MQDLPLALRVLRRSPGFTLLAASILALGIGANTALFSVIRAALLRSLPYPHAERIVAVEGPDAFEYVAKPHPLMRISPDLARFRTMLPVAAVEPGLVNLLGGPAPERVQAAEVNQAFFPVLGVHIHGREFTAADSEPGQSRAVIVSDAFARRFGGPDTALGQKLTLNGLAFTVVGVMPPGVDLPRNTEIWLPFPNNLANLGADVLSSGNISFELYGRLRPGATTTAATAEIQAQLRHEKQSTFPGEQIGAVPWRAEQLNGADRLLWLLLGAAGLVLLIAGADVAHLQLARATARQRETAIRTALGASRWHLLRQHGSESLLLALLGGLGGCLVAYLSLPLLRQLVPTSLPLLAPVSLDPWVLVFALVAALLCAALAGLSPLLYAFDTGTRTTAHSEQEWLQRARSAFVVAEVALAISLFAGAALLVQSMARLSSLPTGFNTVRLLTARMQLGEARYKPAAARLRFYDEVAARLAALPGVEHAGVASNLPMTPNFMMFPLITEEPGPATVHPRVAVFNAVTSDYFRAMGIPLVAGRVFAPQDGPESAQVVVLSRSAAQALWPGQPAVGKHISFAGDKPNWVEVVGVVGDVRLSMATPEYSAMYLPMAQNSFAAAAFLLVRSAVPIAPSALRGAVAAVDPAEPVSDIALESARVEQTMATPRFRETIFGLLAGLALLLAAAGIFGALAHFVERRQAEIGIRMALGASAGGVVRLVCGHAARLVGLGILLGLVGALGLCRVLSSWLFQTGWLSLWAIASALGIILATAALAVWLPARRAARLEPLTAIRRD